MTQNYTIRLLILRLGINSSKERTFTAYNVMGKSKSTEFTEEQNQLAKLAKALGHPARIAILQYLMKRKSCVCGDIVDELPLAQATVSQHLKALKEAGLIQGEISGVSVCYCISPTGWHLMQTYFDGLLRQFQPVEPTCC